MSDAAGKPTDRFELFGFPETLFQPAALGDVLDDDDEMARFTGTVSDRADGEPHPHELTVFAANPLFAVARLTGREATSSANSAG